MDKYYSTYFYTIYAALIVLVPTIMSSRTSELFEFNKILIIYLAAGLVLSGLLWKWLKEGMIRIQYTPLHAAFGLFLLSQVISTFFSIDVQTSLFGYYGRFLGGVTAWTALGILLVGLYDWLTTIDDPSSHIKRLASLVMFMGTATVIWGLFGTFGHDLTCLVFTGSATNACWSAAFQPAQRMFSTLGQPNWLGAFLSVTFALALPALDNFLTAAKSKKLSISNPVLIPLMAGAFSLLGIYLTGSRSAQLATTIILVAWIAWRQQKKNITSLLQNHFKLIVITKIAAVLLGFVLLFFYVSKNVEVTPSNSATSSGVIRQIVWKGAFDLVKSNPVIGTGPETFAYAYYSVRPMVHNLTSEWDYLYNRAHNEFLNIAATSGLLGFTTYLIFLGSIGWVCLNALKKPSNEMSDADKDQLYSMMLALSSICITNFFGFATTSISMLMIMLAVWVCIVAKVAHKEFHIKIARLVPIQAISMATVVGLATVLLVSSYWYADTLFARGKADAGASNYGAAVLAYERALKIRDEHVYQEGLSYSLANLALITHSSKTAESDQSYAKNLMAQSQSLIAAALKRSPENVIYYRTAARIQFAEYQVTGDVKKFEAIFPYLEQAKKVAPTEPKNHYTSALFYSFALDDKKLKSYSEEYTQKALTEIDEAIKMKENYRDAYILKGKIQTKLGDTTGAEASYRYVLDHINAGDEEALQAVQVEQE